jgi:hypothetical protein
MIGPKVSGLVGTKYEPKYESMSWVFHGPAYIFNILNRNNEVTSLDGR